LVQQLTILGFNIKKAPRDQTLQAYPLSDQVAAGITTVFNFPTRFNAVARSILVSNRDGVNAAFIRLNGLASSQIRIPPSASLPINDQWIIQLEVVAGAAGITDVAFEVVPASEVF